MHDRKYLPLAFLICSANTALEVCQARRSYEAADRVGSPGDPDDGKTGRRASWSGREDGRRKKNGTKKPLETRLHEAHPDIQACRTAR